MQDLGSVQYLDFCLDNTKRVDRTKNESELNKCSSLIIVHLQVIYIPRAGYSFFI